MLDRERVIRLKQLREAVLVKDNNGQELNDMDRLMLRTCPFCGHLRVKGEHMSWCEEHNECLCPNCHLCPGTDLRDAFRVEE